MASGKRGAVQAWKPGDHELAEAWIEGDETARWSSASVHGAGSGADRSGSSILEVPPGNRLPRHTDSAEETIVVLSGAATIAVDGEEAELPAGGIAVVPEGSAHEVRNPGKTPLRFAAIYAEAEVTTTYERPVAPDGERERTSTA